MDKQNYVVKRVDDLGLFSAFCKEIGLVELIDGCFPNQCEDKNLSYGQCVRYCVIQKDNKIALLKVVSKFGKRLTRITQVLGLRATMLMCHNFGWRYAQYNDPRNLDHTNSKI